MQQKVGRTEAQWKRRNTVYGIIPINELTIETDWIMARVFNPFQTIHAQLVSLFTKQQILDFTKPRELADDYFKFNEIGSKFSKWVENTVGKGEIAGPQYLLFPKNLYSRYVKKKKKAGLVWERLKDFFFFFIWLVTF